MKFCVMTLAQYVVAMMVVGSTCRAQSENLNMSSMTILAESGDYFLGTTNEPEFGSGVGTLASSSMVHENIMSTTADASSNTLEEITRMDTLATTNSILTATLDSSAKTSLPSDSENVVTTMSTTNEMTLNILGMSNFTFMTSMRSSSGVTKFISHMNPIMPRSTFTFSTDSTTSTIVNPTINTYPSSENSSRIISAGFGIGWIIGFVIGVLLTFVIETTLCLCWRKRKTPTRSSGQSGEYFEMTSEMLKQHSAIHSDDNNRISSEVTKPLIEQ